MSTLLTIGNPKTLKGESQGWITAILHLAPHTLSGVNLCPWASPACANACLNTAGRGGIFRKGETTNTIQQARLRKSRWFIGDRTAFLAQLRKEISAFVRKAHRMGLRPAVRLNGTSDIPWERLGIMQEFPGVQFYDYTKAPHRPTDSLPANYSLTFSRSETNESSAMALLAMGHNVAVVFDRVPATWKGFPVVVGDETDLRFLDPRGVVVGLTAKGKAKKDTSGFVVRA